MSLLSIVLGMIWIFCTAISYFSFTVLNSFIKYQITLNFEKTLPRSIFLAYPGVVKEMAFQLAGNLRSRGFSVFIYEPFNLLNDPVSVITKEIEQSKYVVILNPGQGDWVTSEEQYAIQLGKPIIRLSQQKSHVASLTWVSLCYASLTRGKVKNVKRTYALRCAFKQGAALNDHNRSTLTAWEHYQSWNDYDEDLNAILFIPFFYVLMHCTLICSFFLSGSIILLGGWRWFMLITFILMLRIYLSKKV